MDYSSVLDLDKFNLYINEIKKKYNNSIKLEVLPNNIYSHIIIQFIELMLIKNVYYDTEFWCKNGFKLEKDNKFKKIIKSIEKTKLKGRGSFGKVYKVKSNIFKNIIPKKIKPDIVAVKIEKINFYTFLIDNLIKSIKITNHASKINIGPKLYDTFITIDYDNNIKIVKIFEYIDGDVLSQKKWKSDLEKKQVFKNIKESIRKMNKAGIIHKDLHGGNIMITKTNKVYIIDYDFSTFVENAEQNSLNYMNNNNSKHIINTKLINYIYNDCINNGIIKLPE